MSQPDSSRARAKSIGHYILGLGDMGEYSKGQGEHAGTLDGCQN